MPTMKEVTDFLGVVLPFVVAMTPIIAKALSGRKAGGGTRAPGLPWLQTLGLGVVAGLIAYAAIMYFSSRATMRIELCHWEITGNCEETEGGDFWYEIRANGETLASRAKSNAENDTPAGRWIAIGVSKEVKVLAGGVTIDATLRDKDTVGRYDPILKFTRQLPRGAEGIFRVEPSALDGGCDATLELRVGARNRCESKDGELSSAENERRNRRTLPSSGQPPA
jgi:hypothetical protein